MTGLIAGKKRKPQEVGKINERRKSRESKKMQRLEENEE